MRPAVWLSPHSAADQLGRYASARSGNRPSRPTLDLRITPRTPLAVCELHGRELLEAIRCPPH